MIDVTELIGGLERPGTASRHGAGEPPNGARRPVVVWNVTRTCNLACAHCHADSAAEAYPGELSFGQGRGLLEDLAKFGVSTVVLAGGEPLVRRDTLDLAEYGRSLGLTFTLATNGTLLDLETAEQIRDIGLRYVEIAFDGIGAANDERRGKRRAFERAVQGLRNCQTVGVDVGVRLTLTPQTIRGLDEIFDFIDQHDVRRACFSHFIPAGRGRGQIPAARSETQHALRIIARRTREFSERGDERRIFTADNHADGPFFYLMLLAEGRREEAARAYRTLASGGGGRNSSGVGIAAIDPQGNVYPDRFWPTASLGNLKDRPFSQIWTDPAIELLAGLRDRLPRLWGRCASCRYLDLCGGNLRVRAFAETGDLWAPDPGCHLSDAKIAKDAEVVLV